MPSSRFASKFADLFGRAEVARLSSTLQIHLHTRDSDDSDSDANSRRRESGPCTAAPLLVNLNPRLGPSESEATNAETNEPPTWVILLSVTSRPLRANWCRRRRDTKTIPAATIADVAVTTPTSINNRRLPMNDGVDEVAPLESAPSAISVSLCKLELMGSPTLDPVEPPINPAEPSPDSWPPSP